MIFLPNRKKMMMKLMRLQLKQFMRSKLMKKTKQLTSNFFFKRTVKQKRNQFQARYKISHLIL